MAYQHIKISRDEPIVERLTRLGFGAAKKFTLDEAKAHGAALRSSLANIRHVDAALQINGYDERLLIKLNLQEGAMLPELEAIDGLTIVSQEGKSILLAFASTKGLSEFEARLTTLSANGEVTRKDILFAIQSFDYWTAENRTGRALKLQSAPNQASFLVDVELWPLDNTAQRTLLQKAFLAWAGEQGIEITDSVFYPSLVMVRVRANANSLNALLNHRDVRTVDLPPSVGLDVNLLLADVNQFPEVPPPALGAPKIGVLDSGITTGHPLLKAAVGDAQGYVLPDLGASDHPQNGHGTFVAGIALYGDVAALIAAGKFIPSLQVLSGRVFSDDPTDQTKFVEKCVDEAVRYFHSTYQCRVFNLSYGDRNKIYDGTHVRGLAYVLDRLTRELGVLFVVPTGNLLIEELPAHPRTNYPDYLLQPASRLIDPASALNAITVGGLAGFNQSTAAARNEHTIEDLPIAQPDQPSPFTRSGTSVGGAIKPDFVETAGNIAFVPQRDQTRAQGLGVISLNSGFGRGRPFREAHGTSFAAPKVAHIAAKLAHKLANQTINLTRAILASHAAWPNPSVELLNSNKTPAGRDKLLQLVGYGRVGQDAVFESLENEVTLYAEDKIDNNRSQFYELPIPEEYWSKGRRERQIAISLAYSPDVRTTRLDYRHTKLAFTLVKGASLKAVADAFTKGRQADDALKEISTNQTIGKETRKPCTLQNSSWTFKLPPNSDQQLFIVVTRQDATWSTQQQTAEPYALAVVIRDRENQTVNLYERIAVLVQARAQARERTRIRT
jgi:Subtilase family